VTSRTGTVGLIALILDHDLKGTPAKPNDDTFTVIGYATRTGITVADNVNQSAQDLTMVDVGSLTVETVDFGSPPSGLPNVAGLIGIDVGDSGTFQVPRAVSDRDDHADAQAVGVTGATTGSPASRTTARRRPAAQSYVLARGQTASTLVASAWLAPPRASR